MPMSPPAVALVLCGIPAAKQQHAHSPMIKRVHEHLHVDWVRVGIVALILVCAIVANVTTNLWFHEYSDAFPFIGVGVWVAIVISVPARRPDWEVLPETFKGTIFLLALVLSASMMPVEKLPPASWPSAFGLGFVSAVFDNIPLTALALKQGGYDWGFLAYAVGFGGSMIWFGSSAGVALSNQFPEAKSALAWVRGGWHVAVAYVVGFFVMLAVLGWHPDVKRRAACECLPAATSLSALRANPDSSAPRAACRRAIIRRAGAGIRRRSRQLHTEVMMIIGRMLLVIAAMSCAAVAAAQEITLFQNDNFNGPRYSANGSVTDLGRCRFQRSRIVGDHSRRLVAALLRRLFSRPMRHAESRQLSVALRDGPQQRACRRCAKSAGTAAVAGGGPGGGGFGGGSIVLYRVARDDRPVDHAQSADAQPDGTGFNDRATSAIVNSGTWQLCADADYMSSCEVLRPGQYPEPGRRDRPGQLRAAVWRRRRPGPAPGGGWGGGGGNWGGSSRVVLYEGPNFSGRSYTVNTDVLSNLGNTGFNDRASSIRIERGYWMFCTDANFLGECRTFGPGDYPTLSWLSNRISSGRRISNDYPYNAPPRW